MTWSGICTVTAVVGSTAPGSHDFALRAEAQAASHGVSLSLSDRFRLLHAVTVTQTVPGFYMPHPSRIMTAGPSRRGQRLSASKMAQRSSFFFLFLGILGSCHCFTTLPQISTQTAHYKFDISKPSTLSRPSQPKLSKLLIGSVWTRSPVLNIQKDSKSAGVDFHEISNLQKGESNLGKFNPVRWLAKTTSHRAKLTALWVAIWMLTSLISPAATLAETTAAVDRAGAGGRFASALRFVLHLDKELVKLIATYGTAIYAVLFGIVFCETG